MSYFLFKIISEISPVIKLIFTLLFLAFLRATLIAFSLISTASIVDLTFFFKDIAIHPDPVPISIISGSLK